MDDAVEKLCELLREAKLEPYFHRLDCAVWHKRGPCDKNCGPRKGPWRAKLTFEVEANGEGEDFVDVTCMSCPSHKCKALVFVNIPRTGRRSIHGLCAHCLFQAAAAGILEEIP